MGLILGRIRKETDPINLNMLITVEVQRAMLLHSKKYPGNPRPKKGSMSHFAREAILDKLRDFGVDFRKMNSLYYSKS